ncbi:DotU family type VI secretion system protein [Pluralibacter gergoviae]|uniref:DotU family type VI secretion system protein n=1 Tax=Pluralibacter gergoviae TaxID=61647 RepID=UPI000A388E73|nr:DotU family type VI secretion system protein [Pluralibacter gergoviae]EKT9640663.1 DotU family type VI secretion system protein [Pluralibacter gergoviae]EKV3545071.1 DotU family type VI secretion system protein [Pluralibacter gergoviae]EKV9897774.1 DotU family type VI secretion system protein [Pluralibacter gergoviae]EKV9933545.1 DotU family type VI secretion system protein [Pluralibacter gergoviae]EKW9976006.1 DotU family type VI secretion system protein [Pluralibacter gergoviae]
MQQQQAPGSTQEQQATGPRAVETGASGNNPLVAAASPLLNAIPQIRHSVSHDDREGLRQKLIDEIRRFEVRCQQAGLAYEVIVGARYCLCTALDEAAALTPWGGGGIWSGNGLLVTFHNETWGGEKFFQLLARLSQNPREHINLLELINYCLLLGFEGRYRVMDNGRTQLETIKQRLRQMIYGVRGAYAPPLSPHGEDRPVLRKLWRPVVPLWACAALAGFVACLFYIILNWRLGDATSPVLAKIYQTQLPEAAVAQPAEKPPAVLNLRGFLRPEIEEGLVAVRDEADRSVVILKGDGLFASASTVVRDRYATVIDRIAQAMNNVSGRILVVGYSDNVPIRSARFASNYELSLERARSVQKQLQKHLSQPDRAKAEGRGEVDPIAPNNTPENRARNRRVEITLLVSPDNTQAELNGLPQGN